MDSDAILEAWGFSRLRRECAECGKEITAKNKGGYCGACLCRRANILVTCEECGTQFPRLASVVVRNIGRKGQKLIMCGKKCFGKRMGRLYGFAVHGKGRRKRNEAVWARVWKAHLTTGFGARRLNRLLNVPVCTISSILRAKKKES